MKEQKSPFIIRGKEAIRQELERCGEEFRRLHTEAIKMGIDPWVFNPPSSNTGYEDSLEMRLLIALPSNTRLVRTGRHFFVYIPALIQYVHQTYSHSANLSLARALSLCVTVPETKFTVEQINARVKAWNNFDEVDMIDAVNKAEIIAREQRERVAEEKERADFERKIREQ